MRKLSIVTKRMKTGEWIAYENNMGHPEAYGKTEQEAINRLIKKIKDAR